jgi:hypothetical protein
VVESFRADSRLRIPCSFNPSENSDLEKASRHSNLGDEFAVGRWVEAMVLAPVISLLGHIIPGLSIKLSREDAASNADGFIYAYPQSDVRVPLISIEFKTPTAKNRVNFLTAASPWPDADTWPFDWPFADDTVIPGTQAWQHLVAQVCPCAAATSPPYKTIG